MDDLTKLLAAWEPATPDSPAFRRNVWDRIAARQTRRPALPGWVDPFLALISKPAIAAVAVAASILLGATIGQHLSLESGRSAYLRANNPFAQIQSRI